MSGCINIVKNAMLASMLSKISSICIIFFLYKMFNIPYYQNCDNWQFWFILLAAVICNMIVRTIIYNKFGDLNISSGVSCCYFLTSYCNMHQFFILIFILMSKYNICSITQISHGYTIVLIFLVVEIGCFFGMIYSYKSIEDMKQESDV